MSEAPSGPGCLFRGLRTLVFGLVACTAAMAIAYGTVQYLTRGKTPPGVPVENSVTGPERRILELAAEIERLADDYAERLPPDAGGYSPEAGDWVRNVFRPAVEALRDELDVPALKDHPAVRPLRKALDQARHLAAHPGDVVFRRQTVTLMRTVSQTTREILDAGTG